MDEKKIEKLQKEINENVQNRCPYRFDDPQTKIKDYCGLFDCHCVAMDSVYSHAENKKSLCKIYNDVTPKRKRKKQAIEVTKKRCVVCNKLYVPSGKRQKYCVICANIMQKKAARDRKQNERKTKVDGSTKLMMNVTL